MTVPLAADLEAGLEEAHLFYLRGELHEAHAVLADLKRSYPGNADVERLLAEVVLREPQLAPPEPTPTGPVDWTRALSAELPRWTAGVSFFGLFVVVFGAIRLGPAVDAAVHSGPGSSMTITSGRVYRTSKQVPVWRELCLGSVAVGAGSLMITTSVVAIVKALRTPVA